MEQAVVMINQNFSLFCCAEQYSLSFPDHSLSPDSNYFVRYTYPDRTTKDAPTQLTSASVLTSRSPEYSHPCTVHAKVYGSYGNTAAEDITEFSLDLVSPVEYLFRKFSANEFEMTDNISDKMTSALLAMSLSYYYVMGEHVEKEKRTDEILSTLLNSSQGKMYMNTTRKKEDSSSEESITQFAEHFKLQNTLRYLSGGTSVGDLPVQLPKPLFPSIKKVPVKKPAVTPRAKINSLPTSSSIGKNLYQVPNNRPPSEYSSQPVVDSGTEYIAMDQPDLLNPDDSPANEEDYFFMEQTDDVKVNHQKPLRATMSTPFNHSTEKLVTDEVYELCGSTPAEVAAAAAVKKRGPPPTPPMPYRESRTLDTTKPNSDRKCNSDFKSSLETALRDTSISSTTNKAKSLPQEVVITRVSPLPKKKHNLFTKPKVKW